MNQSPMQHNDNSDGTRTSATPARSKNLPRKILKITGITLLAVAIFFMVVCSAVVWFLHPNRLTPIIERVASENLDADVRIGRAELTFWSSFPKLKVEVSDLTMISHALDSLPADVRATLPSDADSLLSIGRFDGSINLLRLIGGEIALGDVTIDRPRVNLLQVNDSTANFNIVPPSAPDTARSSIPDISINHFVISNARPITYRSMADSIDIAVGIKTIDLAVKGTPLYELAIMTDVNTPLLHEVNYEKTRINLDASISWSGKDPYRVGLKDVIFKAEELDMIINAEIDFRDELRVDRLDFKINSMDIDRLKEHAPPALKEILLPLDTDMRVNVSARLKKPLVFSDSLSLPCVNAIVEIPECRLHYHNARFDRFSASVEADFNGDSINTTSLTIHRFMIDGRAIDIELDGHISDIFTDPRLKGSFKGEIDFRRLPSVIKSRLKAGIDGSLKADTKFDLRLSDLSRDNFHRIYVDGDVDLDNFRFMTNDSVTGIYTRHGCLRFGSDESVRNQAGTRTDSLLVVKLKVDTADFFTDGVAMNISRFNAGIGTNNTSSSLDTTRINPVGGAVSIGRLTYLSTTDSMRLRLREVKGIAMLKRYKGDSRVPELLLNLNAGQLGMSDKTFATTLRDSKLKVTAHLRPRRNRRLPGNATADSIANRRRRQPSRLTVDQLDSLGVETMDFDVDNSLRNLLRRWELEGELSSARGRIRIKSAPIRNTFRNLEMNFTTDSVALSNLDFKMGQSDFNLKGSVSNIIRAMNVRRPGPLKMDLSVESDTINVNQIVRAFTPRATDAAGGDSALDDWEEEEVEKIEHAVGYDSVGGPILVPVNIDAGFSIRARKVLYADMLLDDFEGELLIYRGAIQLHNLSARNEMGSIKVSALYSAPVADKIEFGMGMELKNFKVGRLSSVVPALDTIVPMIKSLDGLVNAKIGATVDIDRNMDLKLPTLNAALKFEGDSLVVFDNKTFRTLSKWLMFKHKDRNMIDSLTVEIIVANNMIQVYPFTLNIDRYRLGVLGHNDLDLNLNYHISVLKSPIPFKFGINIKGTAEHPKFRLGGAKFKEKMVAERTRFADDARVNLVERINTVFRRGLKAARLGPLNLSGAPSTDTYLNAPEDSITRADSLIMIREGLIEAPDTIQAITPETAAKEKK